MHYWPARGEDPGILTGSRREAARDPDVWGSFSGLDQCARWHWTPPSAVVGCKIDCARLKAIIVLAKEMTFVREKFVSLDGKEMFKKGRFNSADVILVVPLPGERVTACLMLTPRRWRGVLESDTASRRKPLAQGRIRALPMRTAWQAHTATWTSKWRGKGVRVRQDPIYEYIHSKSAIENIKVRACQRASASDQHLTKDVHVWRSSSDPYVSPSYHSHQQRLSP